MSDDLRAELQVNGPANIPEFGTVKNADDFRNLLAISAFHRIKDHTAYPAVLLTTGINDPRVDPWQMNKMTARLQAATSSGKPVLLRVDYDAGHGGIGPQNRSTRRCSPTKTLFSCGNWAIRSLRCPTQRLRKRALARNNHLSAGWE